MEKPEIRFLLVISTAHLPQALVDHDVPGYLDSWGTPGVHEFEHGFFLWVPDDPKESAAFSTDGDGVHAQVLAIQLHARELNCDYVMIDADGPQVEGLKTFDWEAEDEDEDALPPCVLAMACFCAGHANGLAVTEPCDTREPKR